MLKIALCLVFWTIAMIGFTSVGVFAPAMEKVHPTEPMPLASSKDEIYKTRTPSESSERTCPDPVSGDIFTVMLKLPEIASGLQSQPFWCAENLKHTKVDLNGDGRDEHLVWMYVAAMCGSKSNCPTAIFAESPEGLRMIYYHPAKLRLEVLASGTRDYRDVESSFNSGVYGQYIEILRFDGTKYQRSKCLDRFPDGVRDEKVRCWEVE